MLASDVKKALAIAEVCTALTHGDRETATSTLKDQYPFKPVQRIRHSSGPLQATRVFIRDNFLDRYSGDRLILPPVLRLISIHLPQEFPYHPNWRTDVTHPAFWEVCATVDHVKPCSLGGSSDDENLVTTSMVRNQAKTNLTCEQLGWSVRKLDKIPEWDGLLSWFMNQVAGDKSLLKLATLKSWYNAARQLWPTV